MIEIVPIAKPEKRRRNPAFLRFVKLLPCMWRGWGGCWGVIEADHAGRRGVGEKSHDDEAVPACKGHHLQRTDRPFELVSDPREMRELLDAEIKRTQERFAAWQSVPF